MGTAKTTRAQSSATKRTGSVLSHRHLIAVEAMLVMNVAKDVIFDLLKKSGQPNDLKVVLIMLTTVGLFGGLFFVLEKLTKRGVAHTHKALKQLPFVLPAIVIHGVLLFLLFLLYARMLNLKVL